MPTRFFIHLDLELLEVGEHFSLLLHREDPCVAGVVVDEGDVVLTSSDGRRLSWSLYVRVDHVEEAFVSVICQVDMLCTFGRLVSIQRSKVR